MAQSKPIYTTENTTFKAIAVYQYWENYGTAENPHWKPKGGHEVVLADGLSHAMTTSSNLMTVLVDKGLSHPDAEDTPYTQYWFNGIMFVVSDLWLDILLINADDYYDYSELNLWQPGFARANADAEYGVIEQPEPFERFETMAELEGC